MLASQLLEYSYIYIFFSLSLLFQIIRGSEILEVLHTNQDVKNYLFSLYNCQYADFFKNLGMHIILNRDGKQTVKC